MALLDEEQPLLRQITRESVFSTKHNEIILDFDPEDPENPRNWTTEFKWSIVLLLACMAFTVTFTCIGVVPVAARIVEDLDGHASSSSATAALLVTSKFNHDQSISVWELGEAAGPLLIAPLSEVLGRYPVMNGCNIAFIIWTLLAASAQSTNVFIVARMLTGLAVASNVLNPAIIGDMFESDQRGSAMSLVMLAPLIGGAVGPAISGAIAQTLGWRQVLLIAAGLAVMCEVLFLTCFRETYKMAILRRRLRKLQEESGEFRKVGRQNGNEDLGKLWHSITRPFSVLFGSSVLLMLSIFSAVGFSYFYVLCISLPQILQEVYGLTPAQTGSAFMSFSVGSFLAIFVCNYGLDRIYVRLRGASGKGQPEHRLPIAIAGALTLPMSVTAYGWITQARLPVFLLLASVAALGFTLILTVVPLSAYVVDAFGPYSASALTGVIVTRCLAGTFFPLGTDPLVDRLGPGLGFTCFGGLSLTLAIVPIIVFRYGERLRQRSEFTRDD